MPFNAQNPYSIVAQVIRDPMRSVTPQQSSAKQAPITEEEAERIVALRAQGLTQAEIGMDVGRSEHVVGHLLRSRGITTGRRKRRGLGND